MSGPYVYIGTYTIKSGRQDEARERCRKLVLLVQEKEPRLISMNICLDDEATQMSVVQVHSDAESMEWHLEVVAQHIATSFESFLARRSTSTPGAGDGVAHPDAAPVGGPWCAGDLHAGPSRRVHPWQRAEPRLAFAP